MLQHRKLEYQTSGIYIGVVKTHLLLAKRTKVVSAAYLIASWLSTLIFLLPESNDSDLFTPTFLLSTVVLIAAITTLISALIYAWKWLRSIHITANEISSGGVGLSQGWAFWSWIVPVVAFWFPPKIIRNCYNIFQSALPSNKLAELKLGIWWFLYLVSTWIGNYSFSTSLSNSRSTVTALDLLSVITLTIAYPFWIRIIDQVTSAQDLAIEARKVENS